MLLIWLTATAPFLGSAEYKICAIGGTILWMMSRNHRIW